MHKKLMVYRLVSTSKNSDIFWKQEIDFEQKILNLFDIVQAGVK